MRIVYLTSQSPRPAHSGHARRIATQLQVLREIGPTRLILLGCRPPPQIRRQLAEDGDRLILPARIDPPATRIWRQLRAVLRGEAAWTAKSLSPARIARLQAEVAAARADVLILAETWLSPLIAPLKPHAARIILDNQNAESVLYRRILRSAGGAAKLRAAFTYANMLQLEARMAAADILWACSDADAAVFARHVPDERIHIVPNVVDLDDYRGFERPERPRSIVFSGTFAYRPNETAALNLIAISDGLVAQGVAHELVLVGKAPTPAMVAAAQGRPQVRITGLVPDTRDHVAAAEVFAAPLDEGSGTKFKLLEAMALGRAIVASPVACEGMGLTPGHDVLLADGPAAFVSTIAALLADPARREALGAAARATVARSFSLDVLRAAIGRSLGVARAATTWPDPSRSEATRRAPAEEVCR